MGSNRKEPHSHSTPTAAGAGKRLAALLAACRDAVAVIDEHGDIRLWNEAATRITGFDADAVVGRPVFDILVPPAHRQQVRDQWPEHLQSWRRSPPPPALECPVWHAENRAVTVEVNCRVLDTDGGCELVVTARDVSDQKALIVQLRRAREELELRVEERTRELSRANEVLEAEMRMREEAQENLERLANFDSLTGLANRALMVNQLRLSVERAKRNRQRLALLYLDLDNFKEINDTFGHSVGDNMLRTVTEAIRRHSRAADMPARLGGDEFVVLMEQVNGISDARRLASRIRAGLSGGVEVEGRLIPCSFSIGVTIFPNHGDNAEDLLRRADLAMHAAKQQGKNDVQVFELGLERSLKRRLDLRGELHRAIANREFVPWYQPLVHTDTQLVSGFEVLLRWISPKRGMVGPDQFIPLLEESQDIITVSDWLFEEVARSMQQWRRAGIPDLHVGFNVSVRQFEHGYLPVIVGELCSRYQLDPKLVTLEITEGILMQNPDESVETLQKLRGLGCSIALDDFGTGYSSLSYLKRFPIDVMKIDRSFVRDLREDMMARDMVESMVDLARKLNIRVVAEGVESPIQRTLLRDMGCEFLQGYLFSAPMPEECFLSWVRNHLPGAAAERPDGNSQRSA